MGRCGVSLFSFSHRVVTAHPRMVSLFLSPCSPFLNPIEESFSSWIWKVYHHQSHDEMSLLDAMNAGWLHISVEDCQAWIRHAKDSFPGEGAYRENWNAALGASLCRTILKAQSVIPIQYTFCQIQRISPHSPIAVRSVCALKRNPVFVHSPGSVNGKQTKWLGLSHTALFQTISNGAN